MSDTNQSQLPPSALERSLLQTIAGSGLSSATIDLADAVLDQALKEGFLRDVPAIGLIVNVIRTGVTVDNYLFLKKVVRFLGPIAQILDEERHRFASELAADEKLRRRVGENLLLVLHRLDDMQKPVLLGRIFQAYMKKRIDFSQLQELSTAVDRVKSHNLPALVAFYRAADKPNVNEAALQDLALSGLVAIYFGQGLTFGPLGGYTKNALGELFVKVALEESA